MPAKRPITLRDLLTFRLGLGAVMVFPAQYPIQKAMEEAGVAPGPYLPQIGADELMKRYGSLPLVHQPGEQWLYNTGSDILGVLIARVTGKTLGAFLARAHLRAARHEGHRLQRAGGQARPARRRPTGPISKTGKRIVFDEARGGASPGRRPSSRAAAGWSRRSTTISPSAA